MVSTFAPALLRGQYLGQSMRRRSEVDITGGPVPVADGHFALTISRAHFWRDAMNLLGLHDLAEDERWGAGWYRQQHKEEYVGRVQERMLSWKRMDLFEELGVRRVVAGPVLTMEELRANPHLAARDFWTDVGQPGGRSVTYPGAAYRMSETPWSLSKPAPRPGEQTFEVLRHVAGVTDDHLLSLLESGVIGTTDE